MKKTILEAWLADALSQPVTVQNSTPQRSVTGNTVVQVETNVGEFVVKQMRPEFASYFTSLELDLAKHAARLQLGPQVVHASIERRLLITKFQPHQALTLKDLENPTVLKNIVLGMRRMHHSGFRMQRLKLPTELTMFFLNQSHTMSPKVSALIKKAVDMASHFCRASKLLPCHLDAHLNNILYQKDGSIQLIDWHEAGMADPWYDLSVFAFYHNLSGEQVASFCESAEQEDLTYLYRVFSLVTLSAWLAMQLACQNIPLSDDVLKMEAPRASESIPRFILEFDPATFNPVEMIAGALAEYQAEVQTPRWKETYARFCKAVV